MDYVRSALLWIWGGIVFLIFTLSLILLTVISPIASYDPILKWICRAQLRALFIRVQVQGLENIRKDQVYLFMCNHVNIFDIFVFAGYLPNLIRGVELDSHFKWPLYGPIIRRIGNIPISHDRLFSAMESLNRARRALESGTSIILLPEGHRTLDGRLRTFKRAPFNLALQAGVNVIPTALIGAFRIKHKGSWLIRPGTITFRIGEPITFSLLENLTSRETRDLVRTRISALLNE